MQVKKSHWERPDQEGSIDNKETNTPDIQHRNWTQTCGSYETSYVIKILFLAIILVSKCWGLAEEGKGHFRHRQKGRGRTNRSFTDTDKQILGGHCLPAKLLPFFVSLYTVHAYKKQSETYHQCPTHQSVPCILAETSGNRLFPFPLFTIALVSVL